MKKLILACLLVPVLLQSCSEDDNGNSATEVPAGTNFRVNYFEVDCIGEAPQKCLLVQEEELVGSEQWHLFYSAIEGFEFEPGFVYNLEVTKIMVTDPPQDASAIQYELVRVILKVPVNCSFEDPAEDLEWLQFEIDQRESNITEATKYCYITQASLNGNTVFLYWDCNPVINKVIPVYDCLGALLGFVGVDIDSENLVDQKIVWQPNNFACTPNF